MWFTKFLTNRRVKVLLRAQEAIPRNKANRQVVEDLVKELNAEFFKKYKPAMGKQRYGTFMYPTIDAYTARLKELTKMVMQQKPIPPDWSEGAAEVQINVDWFLTSSDGYYLNPYSAVRQFSQAVYTLCDAMIESDSAKHGVFEHNFRMLSKLFINLRSVTEDLIKVSLNKA